MKKIRVVFLFLSFCFLFTNNIFSQENYFTNYPWTKLVNVSEETVSNYNQVFLDNKGELIFDNKLYQDYGGQGGFSFSVNDSEELELYININTINPSALRTGNIVSLNAIGNFEDVELGIIKGYKFEYSFSIAGNYLFVEGAGEVDNIREAFNNIKVLTKSVNYPWTSLANVSQELADQYNVVFKEYKDQLLFDDANYEKYGGKGGFTVSKNAFDSLDVNIKMNTLLPVQLRNGVLISLSNIGEFRDTQLGNIAGDDYDYSFSIVNNNLVVNGSGEIDNLSLTLSQNKTFTNNNNLSYDVNYPWTKLIAVNEELSFQYEGLFTEYGNQLIFDSNIFKDYGGQGGFTLSKNAYDELVININIDIGEPRDIRNGQIVSLSNFGNLADAELANIKGEGYDYLLTIKDNFLFIEGSGKVSKLNVVINEKPKLLQDVNYPWTKLVDVDNESQIIYEEVFERNKRQLLFDEESFINYGANGGLTFTKNFDNNIVVTANINSSLPIVLKEGNILSLDELGNFNDVELGRIANENYEYIFSIKSNFLFVEGEGNLGDIKDLNFSFILNVI